MNFVLIEFWILVICTIIGCTIFKKKESRWLTIGFSSFFFYSWWDIKFTVLMIGYSIFTYFVAIVCEKEIKSVKNIFVVVSLGVLAYFKYCNFFIDNINIIFRKNYAMLNVILPLGLSFYVLTSMGYVLDVYHKKYKAERKLLKVIVFITYFPKILSGPIERGNIFFEKLENIENLDLKRIEAGIQIILQGVIKKFVIADRLGVCVDAVFSHPGIYDAPTLICAMFTYSIQIYCDFAGYTDIAKGISLLLGIPLSDNFNLPYCAENPTEFWRRWHMSLSGWFRDYLYIPLGGSRKGKIRKYANTILVMLVSGLWHGANWTFVIWGAIHGIAQCFSNQIKGNKVWKIIGNFLFITFTWTIFRAESLGDVILIFSRIITMQEGIRYIYVFTPLYFVLVLLIDCLQYKVQNGKQSYMILNLKKEREFAIFVTIVLVTIALMYFGNGAFIYNNF